MSGDAMGAAVHVRVLPCSRPAMFASCHVRVLPCSLPSMFASCHILARSRFPRSVLALPLTRPPPPPLPPPHKPSPTPPNKAVLPPFQTISPCPPSKSPSPSRKVRVWPNAEMVAGTRGDAASVEAVKRDPMAVSESESMSDTKKGGLFGAGVSLMFRIGRS